LDGATADELKELAATRRQVAALRRRGELDRDVFEGLCAVIDARERLLRGEEPAPGRASPARPAEEVTAGPVVPEELERVLAACRDVRNLTPDQRRQALAWYRGMPAGKVPRLPARVQLALARVLRMAGLTSRALRVYRGLLEARPHDVRLGRVALEAGVVAAR